MKFYEIDSSIDDILENEVDKETGELTKEGFLALELLEGEKKKKFLGLVYAYRNYKATSEAVKAEIDRLNIQKKRADKKMESIKTFLDGNVPKGETMADEIVKIGWRKSSAVVVECEVEDLPGQYINVKTDIKPDLTSIKEALSDGTEIEGCRIEERQNIQLK